MSSGGFEKVIPLLVGTIAFLLIFSFLVSASGGLAGAGSDPNSPFSFGQGTPDWWTDHTSGGTTKAITNANASSNPYPSGAGKFTHSGHSDMWVSIVRNNNQYHSGSSLLQERYKDCIILRQYSGGVILDGVAFSYPIMTAKANASSAFNITEPFTLWGVNFTLFIETGPSGGVQSAVTFTTLLYQNKYNLSLAESTDVTTDVSMWNVAWWILSFNADWIPTYPAIAYMLSFIIDVILVLCSVRLLQGFIP